MAKTAKSKDEPLEELNEDLENYFANTIIPQLFIDANFILRKFTPPAMKQFKLTKADINQSFYKVVDNIRYPTIIENIQEVMTTGEILEKEVQTTDKKWFQMNILPYRIRKGNKTNGVIITFVDITKRLSVLKELEKLNSEYDILMYALAHDIRQPLSSIFLLSEELPNAFTTNDEELFNKLLDMLNRASESMRSLLSDFTEDIKTIPEEGQEAERINIEQVCNDVILALRDDIYENGVKISLKFKTSEILFPRNNLRSIVYNLLSNAIKYRHPTRPLKIDIATKKKNDHVELSVKDNGIGVEEKYHKEIVKKYVRVDPSIEGTGMGLYILSRMLEEKGGSVHIASTLGKGSTFTVYFKSSYKESK